jgi:hypothetical protein
MTKTTTQSQTEIPTDRPLRGRRLTPAQFYALTGRRLGAANDNEPEARDADAS